MAMCKAYSETAVLYDLGEREIRRFGVEVALDDV
jgi:hypothetical protein